MGDFAKSILKSNGSPAPSKRKPKPVGAQICRAIGRHKYGQCEEGKLAPDGVVTWIPYRGCIRCGVRA